MALDDYLRRLSQGDTETINDIFEKVLPADLAEELTELEDAELQSILGNLEPAMLAVVLQELEPADAQRMLRLIGHAAALRVIDAMPSDDAADLLAELSPEQRDSYLESLPAELADVRQLLTYDEESSGGIMATEFLSVRPEWSSEQALAVVRQDAQEAETAYYVYVTDKARRLIGVLSLRELVLARPDVKIEDIMHTNLVTVDADEDQETVAALFRRYDLLALPVVNADAVMQGIVTADDILDVVDDEATEDIERMAALQPSETPYLDTPIFRLARQRLLWLLILMLSATFTGQIIRRFEDVLGEIVALAVFIPMLMDTAGNSGSQSATLVIRGLALGDIQRSDWLKILARELQVSTLVGIMLAVVNFLRVLLIENYPLPIAAIVSVTLAITVVLAKVIGGLLPVIAKSLRADPAIMAGPLITTIVDALALFVYFSIASSILL